MNHHGDKHVRNIVIRINRHDKISIMSKFRHWYSPHLYQSSGIGIALSSGIGIAPRLLLLVCSSLVLHLFLLLTGRLAGILLCFGFLRGFSCSLSFLLLLVVGFWGHLSFQLRFS